MLRVDFATDDTRRLFENLVRGYETKDQVVALLDRAGIGAARYTEKETVRLSWQALLHSRDLADDLYKLLTAVLDDDDTRTIHDAVRAFRDGQAPAAEVRPSNSDPEAPQQLLYDTLHRHLGEDTTAVAQKLVERIAASTNGVTGSELFDATRLAIEYHLLLAEEFSPTLLIDLAHGRREQEIEPLRRMLHDALASHTLHEVQIKVEPHSFFSRTLEREQDWQRYFDSVHRLSDTDHAPGSTLCRIRAKGFVAPQYLVAGLLPRFQDDWRPIITEYEHQIGDGGSAFFSFQASQWNTWLMWGPSVPICRCDEWEGVRALQYGYGDENNSMPIIGGAESAPTSLDNLARGCDAKQRAVGAVLKRMTGRLRWAPWLLQRAAVTACTNGVACSTAQSAMSGEIAVPGTERWPAARAQRLIYDPDRHDTQQGALVFQADEVREGEPAPLSYYSAYLWLMFLVCRRPAAPGQAPRRLADAYPTANARAPDRSARQLWRELIPVYVHANVADAHALEIHQRALVNNATCLLRQLWTDQPRLFPTIDRSELCFCLVSGSDYSGCGHPVRFPAEDPLVERLRAWIAQDGDSAFTSSILLPPRDETPASRPWELAQFYSACHLPDLVADYYAYVDALARE